MDEEGGDQLVGHVAHDGVDAQSGQATRFVQVVDGPGVDGEIAFPRPGHVGFVHIRVVRMQRLRGDDARGPGLAQEERQIGSVEQTQRNTLVQPTHFDQADRVEAGDDDLVIEIALRDHGQQRFHLIAAGADVLALDLDVDSAAIADHIQHLGQRRDAHAGEGRVVMAAGIQGGQFRRGETGDRAMSIGGGVHIKIVDHDQIAVFGTVYIQFDAVDAHRQCGLKGGQRVFRGDDSWPPDGQKCVVGDSYFQDSFDSLIISVLIKTGRNMHHRQQRLGFGQLDQAIAVDQCHRFVRRPFARIAADGAAGDQVGTDRAGMDHGAVQLAHDGGADGLGIALALDHGLAPQRV